MTEKFEGISKYTKTATKEDNVDTLSAAEWNNISKAVDDSQTAINSLIDDMQGITPISVPGETTDPGVVSVTSKGNTEITSAKNINLEPAYVEGGGEGTYGDIQLKPGDDITLESSHRASSKQGEITIKTSNGKGKNDPDKGTVKLELKTADLELSTEGKPGSDQNVMNVNVTTGNGKGYLKVRAQAIDLRCEDHGGVALQPMGTDGQGHENKIKFEHGGGDGLEFATFNTEKTSIYTDEYRFKKNGVWKMTTRTVLDNNKNLTGTQGVTIGNGKYDPDHDDETKHYSYKKLSDDFYDIISNVDPTVTTEDIINSAYDYKRKKDPNDPTLYCNYVFTKIDSPSNPIGVSVCPSFANIDGGGIASMMGIGDCFKVPITYPMSDVFDQSDLIDIATVESNYTRLKSNLEIETNDGTVTTYWKITREFSGNVI